jgi:hypothetical protein
MVYDRKFRNMVRIERCVDDPSGEVTAEAESRVSVHAVNGVAQAEQ